MFRLECLKYSSLLKITRFGTKGVNWSRTCSTFFACTWFEEILLEAAQLSL